MILKGFCFGMLLQLALGPMSIFIFQTSIAYGFIAGEMGVLGTTIIDSMEIILASIGVGSLLERNKKVDSLLQVFGVIILVAYGSLSLLKAFDLSFMPVFRTQGVDNSANILLQAIVLALSDPLTIVFWAGIFSAKIAEERLTKRDLFLFALGCGLAPFFFLTLVSLFGSMTKQVIPNIVIRCLNFAVGLLMFYFAYKNVRQTPKSNRQGGDA